MDGLPKTIWMLWLQGWEQAPRIVQACRRSWEANNRDWTIACLDRTTAGQYIENREAAAALENLDQPPEACSDRLRIALLAQHGGVWVDATTYCLRPLNDWLPGYVESGFFAFDRPGPDRLISSWFLAAKPDDNLVYQWSRRTLEYWRGRPDRDHYFWFHYLFGAQYETDLAFRRAYDRVPKLSADLPHYYLPHDEKLLAAFTDRDHLSARAAEAPLLKLTHRLPTDGYPTGSVAAYLCEMAGV